MTNPTLWYEKYNVFYYIIKNESMSQTIKDICTWDVDFPVPLHSGIKENSSPMYNKGIAPSGAEMWMMRCDPSQLTFPFKH